ncbi:MAG: PAS domain S-box protein, partial [Opitutaceae bacterium]|nr:PAS domain S-box protein [Cytophagales bacterium]
MKEPKDLFEELIDRISDGLVALDKNWYYTYVNEKGASFLNGHTPAQLIGKHIWTVFPEGLNQPFYKNYEKVMNDRVSITIIDYYEPWDKYFENRINPTKDGGISILFTDVSDQKRAEKSMRESEMYMKMILDNTEEFFVIVDKNYKIVTSNRSVRNFGSNVLESSFQIGANVINLSQESERLQMKALYDNVFSGNHRKIKFKATVKEGIPTILELKLTPIINESGLCEYFIVNTRDVTKEELALEEIIKTSEERKEAKELAIRAFKEKQKIMDSSLDVICSSDDEGRFLQVSIACTSLWGYEPEELLGKSYFDLVYNEDYEVTINASNAIKAGLDTANFENRFVKKDGSIVPIVWSARWDDNDKIMYSIARDASEKKNAEMALLISEQKYRSIFNLSPLPEWIYALSSLKILEVNEAAISHYGFSKSEFLSKTIKEFLPEEDLELGKIFNEVVSEGTINFGHWKHLKANNEVIHVEISGHKINYNGVDCMMIINNDITEKLKSEEIIIQSRNEILASNERFQYVSLATSDAIWDWDMKTNELYLAENFTNLFGHKVENTKENLSTWFQYVHPDERVLVEKSINEVIISQDQVWESEYRYMKSDSS